MAPAEEHLEAADAEVARRNERLIDQRELPPLDAGPEVVLEEACREMGCLHRRLEHPPGAPAALLGIIEGEIGAAKQRLVVNDFVERRDANRSGYLDAVTAGNHRRQAGEHLVGKADRRLRLRRVLDDGELVAAEPGDKVARVDQPGQQVGGLHEKLVADRVAKKVVGVLETVEVDEQERFRYARDGAGGGDRLLRLRLEQRSVGEAGKVVVLGIIADLRLGPTEVGDIGDATDDQAGAVGQHDPVLAGDHTADSPGGIGKELLVDVGIAAVNDQPVIGAKDVGLGLWHKVVVGLADQLFGAVPHQVAHGLVHQDEAAVFVLQEDRVRHRIDDAAQSAELGERGLPRFRHDTGPVQMTDTRNNRSLLNNL